MWLLKVKRSGCFAFIPLKDMLNPSVLFSSSSEQQLSIIKFDSLFDDKIVYLSKGHLCAPPTSRLSGHRPVHIALVLLQVSPPRNPQRVCFQWLLLQMETLNSHNKLPTRLLPHCRTPAFGAMDLYFISMYLNLLCCNDFG